MMDNAHTPPIEGLRDNLLNDNLRQRFEQLTLRARRIRAGTRQGERRSTRRGTSIEFADYRNYSVGDDLRKLDWNLYARLERPYIKLYEDEQDLSVTILIDNSASMDWLRAGAPLDEHKFRYALRLMMGLAAISLRTGDRLSLAGLSQDAAQSLGGLRGRAQSLKALQFARTLPVMGRADLNIALKDAGLRQHGAGLTFLISDMFSPYADGIHALLERGHEVVVLHVLAPDEVVPELVGDLRLIDMETGEAREVSVTPSLRHLYEQRLDAWLTSIRETCIRRGVHYIMATTDTPFERLILHELRRLGIVSL